ncbi:GNAT family N-acetyltransferase [Litorihabitans aurantiacus]|uniref:N-acetyltransferase domain-containing protein n=1 Tax=Litorihabitans aurantiacus TaxID=1930061 RepID=A0AA37XEL6_9MICO|nr:GNAT family N-acetyltransferase [Litorihabitans aurantiacus]GMA31769.1 hypothetical protein GCM10025875_17610 [Litorihabitans aurantiacus]
MTAPPSTPTADVSVRPALPQDAEVIADLQLTAWRERLGDAVVDGLEIADVARTWRDAVTSPPDRRGRVLVATAGPRVVGLAACAPSSASRAGEGGTTGSADDDGGWTAEVVALEVAPGDRRQGHASRLLAAAVDLARDAGAHHVAAWTLREDDARTAFLSSAGLAEAGVRRVLEVPSGDREEILLTGLIHPRA